MIWAFTYFACALWFTCWIVKLLYIAATRGYVMALSRPFHDVRETAQTRFDNPKKFWANVMVALLLLPMAVGGLYFSTSNLWQLAHQQEN